jgi:hypothetical protein
MHEVNRDRSFAERNSPDAICRKSPEAMTCPRSRARAQQLDLRRGEKRKGLRAGFDGDVGGYSRHKLDSTSATKIGTDAVSMRCECGKCSDRLEIACAAWLQAKLIGFPSRQNQEKRQQPGVYLADDLCQTLGHRFILYRLIRRSVCGKAIFH